MVMLKNEGVLPLDDAKKYKNVLMVGDQLAFPVYAGGGSGSVHEKWVKSPLESICDFMDVPRFEQPENATCSMKTCNKEMCIYYTPFLDNAGGAPYRGCEHDVQDVKFDFTLMGAGQQSREGSDRLDLEWDLDTYKTALFVAGLKNPGVKILHLVSSGASIIGFDSIFDSILYSTMPGQEFADALVNIMFGRARPSAKLSFTMPNRQNE